MKKLKHVVLTTMLGIPLILGAQAKAQGQESYEAIKQMTYEQYHRSKETPADYIKRIKSLNYKQVIEEIKTPEEAKKYLTTYLSYKTDQENFGEENYIASFKIIHKNQSDDCNGGSLAAAAILSDDGYPPRVLTMFDKIGSKNIYQGHMVFLYKKGEKWGTLGINPKDCKEPKYSSLEEITRYHRYQKYFTTNMQENYSDWIDNDIDMKEKLERSKNVKEVKKVKSKHKTPRERFFSF